MRGVNKRSLLSFITTYSYSTRAVWSRNDPIFLFITTSTSLFILCRVGVVASYAGNPRWLWLYALMHMTHNFIYFFVLFFVLCIESFRRTVIDWSFKWNIIYVIFSYRWASKRVVSVSRLFAGDVTGEIHRLIDTIRFSFDGI